MEDKLVILVIEDDQAIQTIVEDALTEAGFEPAIAASGEEAVTLLQGGKTRYRALVSDINLLGRIDGWEVAKQAREIDPEFPVIYVTGAAADQWASHGVPNSILLTKPFAPAQLVTAVSNLLNTDPAEVRPQVAASLEFRLRKKAAPAKGVEPRPRRLGTVPGCRPGTAVKRTVANPVPSHWPVLNLRTISASTRRLTSPRPDALAL